MQQQFPFPIWHDCNSYLVLVRFNGTVNTLRSFWCHGCVQTDVLSGYHRTLLPLLDCYHKLSRHPGKENTLAEKQTNKKKKWKSRIVSNKEILTIRLVPYQTQDTNKAHGWVEILVQYLVRFNREHYKVPLQQGCVQTEQRSCQGITRLNLLPSLD